MPSTIIVPLDGSADAERALRPAAEVATRSGAHVVVMTARYGGVVSEPHHYLRSVAAAAGIVDAESMVIEDRLAASAIESIVERVPDPVVCMATHARRGFGEALFGSVAEETLRFAGVPMLLVGPCVQDDRTLEELLLCVDGSSFGSAIVPVAAAWAGAMGLAMVVVGVADERGSVSLESLEGVAREVEPFGVRVESRLLHSAAAAEAIVALASEREHSFVAMATHGRTGLARVTVGSVTMGTVRSAPCPVLAVRPTGLVGGDAHGRAAFADR